MPSLVCSSSALRLSRRSLDWGVETLRMAQAALRDVVLKGLASARPAGLQRRGLPGLRRSAVGLCDALHMRALAAMCAAESVRGVP